MLSRARDDDSLLKWREDEREFFPAFITYEEFFPRKRKQQDSTLTQTKKEKSFLPHKKKDSLE